MTRTRTRAFAVAGILGLALSLTACGGDDKNGGKSNDGGGSSKPLTAEEFRTKANDICRAANVASTKIGSDFGDSPTEAQMADAVTQLVKLVRDEIDDLAALKPPADLAGDYDAMLNSVSRATDALEERGAAYFTAPGKEFDDANAKAKALGLDVCASE